MPFGDTTTVGRIVKPGLATDLLAPVSVLRSEGFLNPVRILTTPTNPATHAPNATEAALNISSATTHLDW